MSKSLGRNVAKHIFPAVVALQWPSGSPFRRTRPPAGEEWLGEGSLAGEEYSKHPSGFNCLDPERPIKVMEATLWVVNWNV